MHQRERNISGVLSQLVRLRYKDTNDNQLLYRWWPSIVEIDEKLVATCKQVHGVTVLVATVL